MVEICRRESFGYKFHDRPCHIGHHEELAGHSVRGSVLQHITQIKRALEIGGVKSSLSAWNVKGDDTKEGVQIDLLIIRDDNVVNLCEMKFASNAYTIDKDEDAKLRSRIEALKGMLTPKQTIHLTMVTTYGIAYGKHSGIVQKEVVMDDLFNG